MRFNNFQTLDQIVFSCFKRTTLLLLIVWGLVGCAGPNIADYKNEKPLFQLEKFFNGDVKAWGIFTDRSGKVVKRFTVDMKCTWNGNEGVLDESFLYSDGTKQKRVWTLKNLGGGRYEGKASDVIGQAQGDSSGNALQWKYHLALPVDEQTWDVEFEDWMYQIDDQVVLNKAKMSKWGIYLGEVTLSFTKSSVERGALQ
jgi:Protein of unknown function (DUF3833)